MKGLRVGKCNQQQQQVDHNQNNLSSTNGEMRLRQQPGSWQFLVFVHAQSNQQVNISHCPLDKGHEDQVGQQAEEENLHQQVVIAKTAHIQLVWRYGGFDGTRLNVHFWLRRKRPGWTL